MTAEGRGGDGTGRQPPRGARCAERRGRPRAILAWDPRGGNRPRGFLTVPPARPGAAQPSGSRWRRAGSRGGGGGVGVPSSPG